MQRSAKRKRVRFLVDRGINFIFISLFSWAKRSWLPMAAQYRSMRCWFVGERNCPVCQWRGEAGWNAPRQAGLTWSYCNTQYYCMTHTHTVCFIASMAVLPLSIFFCSLQFTCFLQHCCITALRPASHLGRFSFRRIWLFFAPFSAAVIRCDNSNNFIYSPLRSCRTSIFFPRLIFFNFSIDICWTFVKHHVDIC